jgi:hypothetical protein
MNITPLHRAALAAATIGAGLAAAPASAQEPSCPGASCPPAYKCHVAAPYPGHCTNNGLVAEGWIGGCTTDMNGDYHYATIGARYVGGNAKFIFHKPHFGSKIFGHDGDLNSWREWDNNGDESGNVVSFSIIRDSHTPSTRIVDAWIRCCDCA